MKRSLLVLALMVAPALHASVDTVRQNFVAYYAVDEGDGDVSAISIFKDEASAKASNAIAADWVMKNVASLISVPPKIISGEVVASAKA